MFRNKYIKYKNKYLGLKHNYSDLNDHNTLNNMNDAKYRDYQKDKIHNKYKIYRDNDDRYGYYQDDIIGRQTDNDANHPYYIDPDDDENVEMDEGVNYVPDLRNDENNEYVNYSDGISLRERITFKRQFNRTEVSDIEDDFVDIGGYGLARGYKKNKDDIDFDKSIIKYGKNTDKNKILFIDNIDDFDSFTEKYGDINEYGDLYIKWDQVSKEYKGFCLDEGISGDRFEEAYYKGEIKNSWWKFEYDYGTDDCIIFSKD